MKALWLLLFLLIGQSYQAQAWRKELTEARRLYQDKKYQEAWQQYQNADKKAPKEVDFSEEMGQSAYRANQYDQAEKYFRKGLGKAPTSKDKARNWHNVGGACAQQQKYDAAEEAFKEALRLNPEDDEARYNLSEVRRKKEAQKRNADKKQKAQKKEEANQQNDQENKQQQAGQNQNQSGKNQTEDRPGQKSKLNDQTTERTLDQLARKEAETKRKISTKPHKSKSRRSSKDW